MEPRKLSQEIISRLRSGFSISSVAQSVNELVLNSLDAKSKNIAVRVNLQTFRMQVVDDGEGMSKENLQWAGIRYMTNKCHTLRDFEKISKFYGFKGESLASIKEHSKRIIISTKSLGSETISKTLDSSEDNIVTVKDRPSQGTTVTIEDFLYNLPVRKNVVNPELELGTIKSYLEALSLIHPGISFTLRNDANRKMIFTSYKCESVEVALINLYPRLKPENFGALKLTSQLMSVIGLIYKELVDFKAQHIYVNRRPVECNALHRLVFDEMVNSAIFKKERKESFCYLFNMKVPNSNVTFSVHGVKTFAEFKEWEVVVKFMHKFLSKFFKREGLEITTKKMVVPERKAPSISDVRLSAMGGACKSKITRRKKPDSQFSDSDLNREAIVVPTNSRGGSRQNSVNMSAKQIATVPYIDKPKRKIGKPSKNDILNNRVKQYSVYKEQKVTFNTRIRNRKLAKKLILSASKIDKNTFKKLFSGRMSDDEASNRDDLSMKEETGVGKMAELADSCDLNSTQQVELYNPNKVENCADEDKKTSLTMQTVDTFWNINNQKLGKAMVMEKFLKSIVQHGERMEDEVHEKVAASVSIKISRKTIGKFKGNCRPSMISTMSYTQMISVKNDFVTNTDDCRFSIDDESFEYNHDNLKRFDEEFDYVEDFRIDPNFTKPILKKSQENCFESETTHARENIFAGEVMNNFEFCKPILKKRKVEDDFKIYQDIYGCNHGETFSPLLKETEDIIKLKKGKGYEASEDKSSLMEDEAGNHFLNNDRCGFKESNWLSNNRARCLNNEFQFHKDRNRRVNNMQNTMGAKNDFDCDFTCDLNRFGMLEPADGNQLPFPRKQGEIKKVSKEDPHNFGVFGGHIGNYKEKFSTKYEYYLDLKGKENHTHKSNFNLKDKAKADIKIDINSDGREEHVDMFRIKDCKGNFNFDKDKAKEDYLDVVGRNYYIRQDEEFLSNVEEDRDNGFKRFKNFDSYNPFTIINHVDPYKNVHIKSNIFQERYRFKNIDSPIRRNAYNFESSEDSFDHRKQQKYSHTQYNPENINCFRGGECDTRSNNKEDGRHFVGRGCVTEGNQEESIYFAGPEYVTRGNQEIFTDEGLAKNVLEVEKEKSRPYYQANERHDMIAFNQHELSDLVNVRVGGMNQLMKNREFCYRNLRDYLPSCSNQVLGGINNKITNYFKNEREEYLPHGNVSYMSGKYQLPRCKAVDLQPHMVRTNQDFVPLNIHHPLRRLSPINMKDTEEIEKCKPFVPIIRKMRGFEEDANFKSGILQASCDQKIEAIFENEIFPKEPINETNTFGNVKPIKGNYWNFQNDLEVPKLEMYHLRNNGLESNWMNPTMQADVKENTDIVKGNPALQYLGKFSANQMGVFGQNDHFRKAESKGWISDDEIDVDNLGAVFQNPKFSHDAHVLKEGVLTNNQASKERLYLNNRGYIHAHGVKQNGKHNVVQDLRPRELDCQQFKYYKNQKGYLKPEKFCNAADCAHNDSKKCKQNEGKENANALMNKRNTTISNLERNRNICLVKDVSKNFKRRKCGALEHIEVDPIGTEELIKSSIPQVGYTNEQNNKRDMFLCNYKYPLNNDKFSRHSSRNKIREKQISREALRKNVSDIKEGRRFLKRKEMIMKSNEELRNVNTNSDIREEEKQKFVENTRPLIDSLGFASRNCRNSNSREKNTKHRKNLNMQYRNILENGLADADEGMIKYFGDYQETKNAGNLEQANFRWNKDSIKTQKGTLLKPGNLMDKRDIPTKCRQGRGDVVNNNYEEKNSTRRIPSRKSRRINTKSVKGENKITQTGKSLSSQVEITRKRKHNDIGTQTTQFNNVENITDNCHKDESTESKTIHGKLERKVNVLSNIILKPRHQVSSKHFRDNRSKLIEYNQPDYGKTNVTEKNMDFGSNDIKELLQNSHEGNISPGKINTVKDNGSTITGTCKGIEIVKSTIICDECPIGGDVIVTANSNNKENISTKIDILRDELPVDTKSSENSLIQKSKLFSARRPKQFSRYQPTNKESYYLNNIMADSNLEKITHALDNNSQDCITSKQDTNESNKTEISIKAICTSPEFKKEFEEPSKYDECTDMIGTDFEKKGKLNIATEKDYFSNVEDVTNITDLNLNLQKLNLERNPKIDMSYDTVTYNKNPINRMENQNFAAPSEILTPKSQTYNAVDILDRKAVTSSHYSTHFNRKISRELNDHSTPKSETCVPLNNVELSDAETVIRSYSPNIKTEKVLRESNGHSSHTSDSEQFITDQKRTYSALLDSKLKSESESHQDTILSKTNDLIENHIQNDLPLNEQNSKGAIASPLIFDISGDIPPVEGSKYPLSFSSQNENIFTAQTSLFNFCSSKADNISSQDVQFNISINFEELIPSNQSKFTNFENEPVCGTNDFNISFERPNFSNYATDNEEDIKIDSSVKINIPEFDFAVKHHLNLSIPEQLPNKQTVPDNNALGTSINNKNCSHSKTANGEFLVHSTGIKSTVTNNILECKISEGLVDLNKFGSNGFNSATNSPLMQQKHPRGSVMEFNHNCDKSSGDIIISLSQEERQALLLRDYQINKKLIDSEQTEFYMAPDRCDGNKEVNEKLFLELNNNIEPFIGDVIDNRIKGHSNFTSAKRAIEYISSHTKCNDDFKLCLENSRPDDEEENNILQDSINDNIYEKTTAKDMINYPDKCGVSVGEETNLQRAEAETTRIKEYSTCENLKMFSELDRYELDKELLLDGTCSKNEWLQRCDTAGRTFFLNKRTGMTTYKDVKQSAAFTIVERSEFVPKGQSPILMIQEPSSVSLTSSGKVKLYNALADSYKQKLGLIKWNKIIRNKDPRKFFDDIYKHLPRKSPLPVISLEKNKLILKKSCHFNKEVVFSKDIFDQVRVIGQLDKKFIVAVTHDSILILFDQHAVDERIRVEMLYKGYTKNTQKEGLDEQVRYKHFNLKYKLQIGVTEEDASILNKYTGIFNRLGLWYTVNKGEIIVSAIPNCLYNKAQRDKSSEKLKELILALIEEEVEVIKATNGIPSSIPKVIQNVVNSEACRGSIMFGDPLDLNKSSELISKLKECNLPFQCAHGRPTLAPIMTMVTPGRNVAQLNLKKLI